jgi:hypothetical protein
MIDGMRRILCSGLEAELPPGRTNPAVAVHERKRRSRSATKH